MTMIERFFRWTYRFFVGPFEEKTDGLRRGSMKRWQAAAFTATYCYAMVRVWDAINWPTFFLGFAILFALVFAQAPAREMVSGFWRGVGGFGGSGGVGSFRSTTTQTAFRSGQLEPPADQSRPLPEED